MKADKSLEFKSAIICLKQLNNGSLAVMSQKGDLRCINVSSYKTISGFKTNIKQIRFSGHQISISSCGRYAAFAIPHSPSAVVYDVLTKKVLHTTSGHKGDIESVCVDESYIVTGGTDGRTYVYNILTNLLVFTFPPHADYITALVMDSLWIVTASYDKAISILNLSTMKTPVKLRGHSSVIVQMKLLENMQMISVDKEGNILIWNLKTAMLLRKLPKANDDIVCLTVSKDERFLFLGSKLGYVFLYDLQEGLLLKSSFIKENSKICSLILLDNEKQIVVGTKSGQLNFYPLIPNEDDLLTQLKNKEYLSLYKAAEENPLLNYSPVFSHLESLWESSIEKAKLMLEREQKSNAEVILAPFKSVPLKNTIIKNLLQDYLEFNKFKNYVIDKKYSLAYPLAALYPNFQETDIYIAMEKEWHVKFNKAKLYILEKEGEEKVRKFLSDFRGISQKSMFIQSLFSQRTVYMLFKKKLAQKDYIALFSLLDRFPFIKQFDEYNELVAYADSMYIKATQALENKQYSKVVEFSSILLYIPEFKEEAQEMISINKAIKDFLELYEKRNIQAMYESISQSPSLLKLQEAKELNDDWNEHLKLAQKFASKADVINVVAALEDFFEINVKFLNIALVVKQAYIAQFHRGLRAKKSLVAIENGVKQYILFFGIDESIEEFMEEFQNKYSTTLDILRCEKGNINMFKPFMIIAEIIK